jgi:hypothetical protein
MRPGAGSASGADVRVLDIGCGANLIYPLLGAAMHGWAFVGADITEAALAWAEKNKNSNPHLAPLLELRRSGSCAGGSDSGLGARAGAPLPAALSAKLACQPLACQRLGPLLRLRALGILWARELLGMRTLAASSGQ